MKKIHSGWKNIQSPKTTSTGKIYSPIFTALVIICFATLFLLWFVNPSNAAEECLDGTWVHSQEIDDFVCVKDDGVYIPPTD